MESIYETAVALHSAGVMDDGTLGEFARSRREEAGGDERTGLEADPT